MVEGVIDALSIILLTGNANVLAVPGVGQIEKALQEKIGLLSRLRVLSDRDEHGEGFSKKLRDQMAVRFPNVEITLNRYPEGVNDGNEWLNAKNPYGNKKPMDPIVNLDNLEKIPPTVDDLDLFKEKDPLVPV